MLINFALASLILAFLIIILWSFNSRQYKSSSTVSSSYDAWTNEKLLEELWGEHIHLGYYSKASKRIDFRQAKIDFVHNLVHWSGLDKLPKGSRIIDIGCGIGGSSRILARDYGFDVLGITISSEQVKRAKQLTSNNLCCRFEVMDALDLQFSDGSFDGVWSVEAGAHILNKQRYADEMLRVLRPGGFLAVADWNRANYKQKSLGLIDSLIMKQLLDQWSHPEFSSIKSFSHNLLNSQYCGGKIESDDWSKFTKPSWIDSIIEGFRRLDVFIKLGPKSFLQGMREIPTILLMRMAFGSRLMQFGVFRSRG